MLVINMNPDDTTPSVDQNQNRAVRYGSGCLTAPGDQVSLKSAQTVRI